MILCKSVFWSIIFFLSWKGKKYLCSTLKLSKPQQSLQIVSQQWTLLRLSTQKNILHKHRCHETETIPLLFLLFHIQHLRSRHSEVPTATHSANSADSATLCKSFSTAFFSLRHYMDQHISREALCNYASKAPEAALPTSHLYNTFCDKILLHSASTTLVKVTLPCFPVM